MSGLQLSGPEREQLWRAVGEAIEQYVRDVERLRVAPADASVDPAPYVDAFDFQRASDPAEVVRKVVEGLRARQVHTPHPGYFGLFNPAPTTMGVAADALVAAFNPQLATYSHSPFAVAAEQRVIRELAARFGFDGASADGTFCSGGAEANHTALLVALGRHAPKIREEGLRSLEGDPTIYVTVETHRSITKAAQMVGLGARAVRDVAVDVRHRMDPAALEAMLARDRAAGCVPFLVVGTAGTTSGGTIDPLGVLADVAAREGLWLHVDAAWGGAAALVPELGRHLDGIARADSLTFDAHKWLSVPMGAGLFITRHRGVLDDTFAVDASYMPHRVGERGDPYARSMQWSRRFIGLKVLMSLAVAGWEGYADTLRRQTRMGDALRERLVASGFAIVNDTPLPLVCFVDDERPDGRSAAYLSKVRNVVESAGDAWISVTRLGSERTPALRACVTNTQTTERDLDRLVARLLQARRHVGRA